MRDSDTVFLSHLPVWSQNLPKALRTSDGIMTDKQPIDNSGPEAEGGMQTLALSVSYDGSAFMGFARQPSQVTVQGELEQALRTLFKSPIATVGAGRTDAGVHARNQVVSFEIPKDELQGRSFEKLRLSLNALTPEELVIKAVTEKPAGFSARFSALQRVYRYRVIIGPFPPVFLARYAWWIPSDEPFDVQIMKKAARCLEGEHDFKTFCVAKSGEGLSTMRRIDEVFIFGSQHLGESCLVIQVTGNAFLHSMIRIIVGSLVEVGLGRQSPEWIEEILKARDRCAAAQTAPACGLTLWDVRY